MKRFLFLLLAPLGACHDSPSVNNQPITGDHPAPADTTAGLDTMAASGSAAPFVHPTQSGRQVGSRHPSPPASRTR